MTHHAQVGGNHYNSGLEVQWIDIMSTHNINASEATVVKYILRYRRKNGIQDLKKAMDYLNNLKHHWPDNTRLPSLTKVPQLDGNTDFVRLGNVRALEDFITQLNQLADSDFHVTEYEYNVMYFTLHGNYSTAIASLKKLITDEESV